MTTALERATEAVLEQMRSTNPIDDAGYARNLAKAALDSAAVVDPEPMCPECRMTKATCTVRDECEGKDTP